MSTWQPERPPRSVLRRVCRLLAALAVLTATPARAGMSEQWYLFRARSNMEIRNYKAAIEAYRKVLEEDPHHRDALRGLGAACEANGQTDEAIAAYDRFLERYHDEPEIAFKQARFLGWSRYEYRRADAIRYYRMGLQRKDAPEERYALAKLLGRDKATLDEALAEYRTLVKQRPQDRALREEYRKLLLWDPRHLHEATEEYARLAAERPEDRAVSLQYARLLAQDPGRTHEAAERYAPLVERSPKDRALRLEYARVLARDPSRRAEAREQLRLGMGSTMAGKPDFQTRLLYADLLAADESQRDEALTQYASLVEEQPKNTGVRLRYARMLGARKESSVEAISQYERVLASEPENAEAHEGLARAHAWNGDSDRALHHNQLALQHGGRRADLRALQESLTSGREPRAGGGVSLLVQPGDHFGLTGLRMPVVGRMDVSPFVTTLVDAGFESYWGPQARTAAGAFFTLGTELRFGPVQRARLELGYHTVRPGAEALRGMAEFELRDDTFLIRPRFERQPRYDSFQSLVGGGVGPGPTAARTGAVSTHALSVHLERQWGPWRAWATPLAGLVGGAGAPMNLQLGMSAAGEVEVLAAGAWQLAVGLDASVSHFGFDASALEEGAYFSPALHAVQTPRLTVRHAVERSLAFELSGGPSLQYQLLHSGEGGFLPGAQARFTGSFTLAEHLHAGLGAALVRMGDAYLRMDVGATLSYVF
jgi:cellulose synthase operon protein C